MSNTVDLATKGSSDVELGKISVDKGKPGSNGAQTDGSGGYSKETDGTLPKGVKLILDAAQQQAQAVGIVMALFAGALVSLAQMIESAQVEKTSNAWGALRAFLYGAIMLNLLGAFMSLITIKMCSDLPIAYYQTSHGLKPKEMPQGCKSSSKLEPFSRKGLLTNAGMARTYFIMDSVSAWVLLAACMCTFTSLTLWVSINTESHTTLGFTLAIFIVCGLIFVVSVRFAGRAQGWV